jgi:transcriptional regulator with XRE-family HTH domain
MAETKRKSVASAGDIFSKGARPDSRAVYFGDNLRRLIGVHCAHGALVAEALGVSRQTVSDLIGTKRRHAPSLDTLYRAAELFGVDADTLYRRPFWEWAPAYFADMAEPIGKTGMIGADAVSDALLDAAASLRNREAAR